jgi:3-phenylpropionate/trans-cinnamate dioxygenase ferredoxin reductase component
MNKYQYLIVGGGLAGDAAARGIRELDPNGPIGMISAEPDPPYTRPTLSKGLWKGRPIEKIWRNTQALGVDLHLGRQVVKLDPLAKCVGDDGGNEYSFDKLLLATGGSPVHLTCGAGSINYFRDLQDYHRLRDMTEKGEKFLVIGGGFIGSELAAALRMVGKDVALVFPEDAIGWKRYPPELARFLNDYYRQKGVEVVPNQSVANVMERDGRYTVWTQGGMEFVVDGVVAGIGIRPNLELATQAGLQMDDGIVVDKQLQTSASDIYAAGDVVNFIHAALGKRVRVEHEDNALMMGKQAGRNMAGANEPYTHVPMFYSDLFDLGYEAVGELDSRLETCADWQEPFQKGTVYYLEQGRVRGVLLWNVWRQVDAARALLAEAGPFTPKELTGRLR